MMKQVGFLVFLLLGLVLDLTAFSSGASENLTSHETAGTTLKITIQSPDSSDIQTVTSLMQHFPINAPAETTIEITINKNDSVQKEDNKGIVIPPVIIESVFHFSFFKKRESAMAMGFENYFKIHDFDAFKMEYLDTYPSDKYKLVFFGNGIPYPSQKLFLFDEKLGTISFMMTRSDTLTQNFVHSFISKFKFRIKDPYVGFGYYDTQAQKWVKVASLEIRQFDILKPYTMIFVGIWFIFLVIFFYRLGKKTNLLKTGISEDSPFSLSLSQFAFWTVIIFTSYFYLWIVNLELPIIPSSTLILLGITAATTAGSMAIDVTAVNKPEKISTRSLFKDLLTDGDSGYSVHRCQLVLVTMMFGAFYMVNVVRMQELPDFDNSLLWMIGISSGTFVGIKSVEGMKQQLGIGNNVTKTNPPAGADQTPNNKPVV